MGNEGRNHGGPDLDIIAPLLNLLVSGGQVQIRWGWQGHGASLDLIEIQVDRGAGYGLLTYDTTPLPPTPGKWTYKAIYRIGDSQVGQWSAESERQRRWLRLGFRDVSCGSRHL